MRLVLGYKIFEKDSFNAIEPQHFQRFDLQVTCNQCGKECASVRDLDHHRRTDHIVASCELCGRPFYNPAGTCFSDNKHKQCQY